MASILSPPESVTKRVKMNKGVLSGKVRRGNCRQVTVRRRPKVRCVLALAFFRIISGFLSSVVEHETNRTGR